MTVSQDNMQRHTMFMNDSSTNVIEEGGFATAESDANVVCWQDLNLAKTMAEYHPEDISNLTRRTTPNPPPRQPPSNP